MVFSSALFIFLFLPAVLCIYHLVTSVRPRWSNSVLVFFSVLFYIWGAPKSFYLGLFFVSIVVDYLLARCIEKNKSNKHRQKQLVLLSVIINLGILAYYKYANFFMDELCYLLENAGFQPILWSKVVLPIGISFFVFHKISYIVDVYREKAEPLRSILDFTMYLLLFPQLIAGPIVRFHEIESQIRCRKVSIELFYNGICRFSIGLAKKVLIANSLGGVVDHVFKLPPSELNFLLSWIAAIFYAFQIYYDFSGYSDMAIGLGNMFGFHLPENFNQPYVAQSITEFWRRWHMSLSRFFKDYVYLPLGGNRCSTWKMYLNLWTVFLLCGLWHGANWVFVVWGIYHGFLLLIDKLFLLKKLEKMPDIVNRFMTFLLIVIGWVFFRSEDMTYALQYLSTMFNLMTYSFITPAEIELFSNKVVFYALVAGLFSFIDFSQMELNKYKLFPLAQGVIAIILLLYCTIVLSTGSFNPFIYFQF